MAYKGKYRVKHPEKYNGNPDKVQYRSLWERQVMRWLDDNVNVKKWSYEEVIVPYRCKTDNKLHRYFVDFYVEFTSGQPYLIEVKPEKETIAPKVPTKKTSGFVRQVMTYAKNQSKWEAATAYANDHGMLFEVWTEKSIKALGIKLLT